MGPTFYGDRISRYTQAKEKQLQWYGTEEVPPDFSNTCERLLVKDKAAEFLDFIELQWFEELTVRESMVVFAGVMRNLALVHQSDHYLGTPEQFLAYESLKYENKFPITGSLYLWILRKKLYLYLFVEPVRLLMQPGPLVRKGVYTRRREVYTSHVTSEQQEKLSHLSTPFGLLQAISIMTELQGYQKAVRFTKQLTKLFDSLKKSLEGDIASSPEKFIQKIIMKIQPILEFKQTYSLSFQPVTTDFSDELGKSKKFVHGYMIDRYIRIYRYRSDTGSFIEYLNNKGSETNRAKIRDYLSRLHFLITHDVVTSFYEGDQRRTIDNFRAHLATNNFTEETITKIMEYKHQNPNQVWRSYLRSTFGSLKSGAFNQYYYKFLDFVMMKLLIIMNFYVPLGNHKLSGYDWFVIYLQFIRETMVPQNTAGEPEAKLGGKDMQPPIGVDYSPGSMYEYVIFLKQVLLEDLSEES